MKLVTQYVQGCWFKWEVVLSQQLIVLALTHLQRMISFQEWAYQRHLLLTLAQTWKLKTFNSLNLACLQVSQHRKIVVLLTTILLRYLSVLNCVCQQFHLFLLVKLFYLLLHGDFMTLFLLRLSSKAAFPIQPFTVVLFAVTLFLIALLAALLFVSVVFLLLLQQHLQLICVKSLIFLVFLFRQLIRLLLQLQRQQTFDLPFPLPDVLFQLFHVLALP